MTSLSHESTINNLDRAMLSYVFNSFSFSNEHLSHIFDRYSEEIVKGQEVQGYWNADTLYKCGSSEVYFGSSVITTSIISRSLTHMIKSDPLDYSAVHHVSISDEIMSKVGSQLNQFVKTHRLLPPEKQTKYINLVLKYTKYCSPSENQLKLSSLCSVDAYAFLGKWLLIFYIINNMNESGTSDKFGETLDNLSHLIDSGHLTEDRISLFSATNEFMLQLRTNISNNFKDQTGHFLKSANFSNLVSDLFDSMKSEEKNRYKDLDSTLTIDDYMNLRKVTIACKPWYFLCASLMGIQYQPEDSPDSVEKHATELIIYANDLGSYHVDKQKGKQNIVYSYGKDFHYTEHLSKLHVKQRHDDTMQSFTFERNIGNAWHQFLETCVSGTIKTMRELPSRYTSV